MTELDISIYKSLKITFKKKEKVNVRIQVVGVQVFTVRFFQLGCLFKLFHNKMLENILSSSIVDITRRCVLKGSSGKIKKTKSM